jgi:protein-S-isoprenylcysteine O-methyltransferase Ste14
MTPTTCVFASWLLWLLVWLVTARWSAATLVRQPPSATHSVLLWGGVALVFVRFRRLAVFALPLFPSVPWAKWVGVVTAGAGLVFACWARARLGPFWSADVALKAGHALVRSGPYAVTRHPIYTGLLVGLTGTMLVRDTVAALLGLVLATVAVVVKLRQEERLLTQHFGRAYETYKAEVPALVPRFW